MHLYLLTFLTLASLFHHSHAQNSKQDYLDEHNKARALVGVGPMTWDDTLAEYALNHTNSRIGNCSLTHSYGPYGENIAKGYRYNGTTAVNRWLAEKSSYNHEKNTCAPLRVCGHYTQVVWKNSIRLGCARAMCINNGWWFITCSYDPKGNYNGQKPY